jgi:hypothetical protein
MYSRYVIDTMIPVLLPCLVFLIWYVSRLLKFGETTTEETGPPNPEPEPESPLPVIPDSEVTDERDFYASYARMLDSIASSHLDDEIAQFQKENPLTPAS